MGLEFITPDQPSNNSKTIVYASFAERLVAVLIDGVVGTLASLLLIPNLIDTVTFVILWNWLYPSLMLSSPYQATVGKIVMKIIVTDNRGERLNFSKATIRVLARLISDLTLGIGYLMMLFNEKRKCLHDQLAETLVVRI